MKKELKVAIVQTTLDNKLAWNKDATFAPRMDFSEAARVWNEIIHTFDYFINLEDSMKPEIIVLPELCIAKRFENQITKLANQSGCIIISGLDFYEQNGKVENKAIVAIPYRWPHNSGTSKFKKFYFGKYFPAKVEDDFIKSCNKQFSPCDNIYILDVGLYGRIGLAICADFYDIGRFALYKGRIQHLIIVAYNKDIKSFYFLCEAISRLVYCNVIICNTGHYGGSVCFSLYDKEYQRYIYKHEGANLFTSQIVKLPVRGLLRAQKNLDEKDFKHQPPGFDWKYDK